jgi:hypothetical protein
MNAAKNKGEAKHPQAGKDAGKQPEGWNSSPGIRRPRDGFEGKPSLGHPLASQGESSRDRAT